MSGAGTLHTAAAMTAALALSGPTKQPANPLQLPLAPAAACVDI